MKILYFWEVKSADKNKLKIMSAIQMFNELTNLGEELSKPVRSMVLNMVEQLKKAQQIEIQTMNGLLEGKPLVWKKLENSELENAHQAQAWLLENLGRFGFYLGRSWLEFILKYCVFVVDERFSHSGYLSIFKALVCQMKPKYVLSKPEPSDNDSDDDSDDYESGDYLG